MEPGVKLNNHDDIYIFATGRLQIWLKAASFGKDNIISYIVHTI